MVPIATLARSLAAAAAVVLLAVPAGAQTADHLQCYKIKDTNPKTNALVNLDASDDAFPVAAGCKLKTRSKEYCTPAIKTLVQPGEPVEDVSGQALANSFFCYKVACPKQEIGNVNLIADQFGSRMVSGFKTKRLCVPAETVVLITTTTTIQPTTTTIAPTTTTLPVTTTLAEFCGNGIVEGDEDCDDNGMSDGDGCSVNCTQETGFDCTGQPSICQSICGDGLVRGGEGCDDAPPAENGDGCSDQCQEESGFTCVGEPSVCVPL